MDIKYKSQFEFLDLSGVDDRTRVEINFALNSGAATEVLQLPWDTGEETDYYEPDVVELEQDESQTWQSDEAEHSQASYESELPVSCAGVIPTLPSPHVFAHPPPPIITPVCGGMLITQPSMYGNEMVPELGMHQYVSGGMDYQQSMYLQSAEIHDVSISRDNRRRNHRGRGSKRDSGSRYDNEMATVYLPQQGQYQRLQRNMCPPNFYYQTEQPNIQRQRPYHSGQTPYSPPPPRPAYNQGYSGGSNQYTRHIPVPQTPRQRSEAPKHSVKHGNEQILRPTASTYGPPPLSIQRKTESVNNSQTKIDCVTTLTTVIVNNSKIEHSVNNGSEGSGSREECTETTTKYSSNNNKVVKNSDSSSNGSNSSNNKVPPVNVTIEHNIVTTVNKGCELAETNDCPRVNINSSVQVKQQKTETSSVEIRKETVSLVQSSTTSLPQVEEQVLTREEKLEEKPKEKPEEKPEESPPAIVKEALVESKESESLTINNATKAATTESSSQSWASILKKSNTETFASGISNGKPTARINPLRIDVVADSEGSNKFNSSNNEAPGTRQLQGKPRAFSNSDNSGAESNASSRNDQQEEYDSSKKFDDLDAHKTGEFLLKYQMEKQTVSLLPRGLINRNNYCYINSILQALLACPPFYNLLIALPYSKNTSRNSTSNNLTTNMIRFVHEFSPLSAGARLTRKDRPQKRNDEAVVNVQSGIAFEPSYVYTMLKNTSCASVFSVEGRQEDAEEFLSCLLNGISDEMLEMMKLGNTENPPPVPEAEPVQSSHGGEQEEWKIMGPKNKGSITRCTDFGRTPLSDIFRGQLRYKVSRAGEQSTDNVQPFFTLQLDIEKAESVKGALEILVGKDQLEGMTCSKTKREIEAWKQVTLEELPVILILHLKWFDYKLDGCSKILKSVEFPIDLKIDGKILSTNTSKKLSAKQKQYKLFAVTYHDGKEATKGHYVTDAFHVGYGGWVRYDDSSLKGVSEHNVLNPLPPRVPYLLYYRRCDTIGGNNQLNSTDRIR